MKLPVIIQLWRELRARRQSVLLDCHPGLILLAAFAGPLFALSCFGAYRGMQQYAAKGLPVVSLFVAALAVWIGVALNRQLQLSRDRKWNDFIRYMPVRPIHLLALHIYVGVPVGLIGLVLLICGLCGIGAELWTINAAVKWLTIVTVFLWALSLASFLGVIASRFSWGQRFLLSIGALWGILFLARLAWGLRSGNPSASCLTDVCLTDPLFAAVGMISFVCTVIPQQPAFPVAGPWAVLHLGLVSAILTVLSWRLVRQPPLSLPARPKDLLLTIPLRKGISRILPDSRGGQIGVELLGMLRGPHIRILFYVVMSVMVGLGLQIIYPAGDNHILMLVVFAMFAVNERADLLQIRQTDYLYYLHGVDARDYLFGLTVAVGLLISILCMIQVPIFRGGDIHTYSKTICVCVALAFSSMGMNVAFDHYSRHTRFFRYLIIAMLFLAVISKAWAMIPLVVLLSFNVLRIPCLIYGLVLLSVSLGVNGFFPLLIAGVIIALEIVRTSRDIVKKWYWRIAE